MPDSHTEITSQSWFSRISESIKGILFGLILIPGSIFLLWWNEGRALTTANSIKEIAAAVVTADSSKVDPANQMKPVHVSGEARADEPISDPVFGISIPALRLERKVEIYQWKEETKTETHEKTGGSKETVTTYTYEKKWVDDPIDSSHFKQSGDHRNTGSLIAPDESFNASNVKLGAFRVPESMVSSLPGKTTYTLTDADYEKLGGSYKPKAKLNAGKFYFGNDPTSPQIGDQRVEFEFVKPGVFSLIAQQTGDTFQEYQTKSGDALSYIEPGTVSAVMMLKNAADRNTMFTWLGRLGGFVLMGIGFMAIMRPLAILGSVLPILGNIIGVGTGLISFALAGTISAVVIAIAWLAVRPALGIGLLVVAIGGLLLTRKLAKRSKTAA